MLALKPVCSHSDPWTFTIGILGGSDDHGPPVRNVRVQPDTATDLLLENINTSRADADSTVFASPLPEM